MIGWSPVQILQAHLKRQLSVSSAALARQSAMCGCPGSSVASKIDSAERKYGTASSRQPDSRSVGQLVEVEHGATDLQSGSSAVVVKED